LAFECKENLHRNAGFDLRNGFRCIAKAAATISGREAATAAFLANIKAAFTTVDRFYCHCGNKLPPFGVCRQSCSSLFRPAWLLTPPLKAFAPLIENAVRPTPDRTCSSALLNWRCGNFAARKGEAAMVVVEQNESFSTASASIMVASFVISVPFTPGNSVFRRKPPQHEGHHGKCRNATIVSSQVHLEPRGQIAKARLGVLSRRRHGLAGKRNFRRPVGDPRCYRDLPLGSHWQR
jgi:hypothetical protein